MTPKEYQLILIRHGESVWNKENRFTGWTDVDLTEKGLEEAHTAAQILRRGGFDFDIVYTSVLKRAIRSVWIILDDLDRMWLPVIKTWRLNERHYGNLQGLNKDKTAQELGVGLVMSWRRSFDGQPPALDRTDVRYPGFDVR